MASKIVVIAIALLLLIAASAAGNFNQDFDILYGDGRVKILNNGQLLTLSLDKASGSGIHSKNQFLFGKFDMQIKLVPGNSAGTATTFYLSSDGDTQDEIDFEFLGNLSGDPYILHTNVHTKGKGNREQQIYLWFDPTKDFHTYSILWNPQTIIFYVDGMAIREFKNLETKGVPFLKSQAMWLKSTLWNADNWATRGGRVKIDWSQAPFTASYRNFDAQACVAGATCSSKNQPWMKESLDAAGEARIRWVQKNFMVYNYCTDPKRLPQGLPIECKLTSLA